MFCLLIIRRETQAVLMVYGFFIVIFLQFNLYYQREGKKEGKEEKITSSQLYYRTDEYDLESCSSSSPLNQTIPIPENQSPKSTSQHKPTSISQYTTPPPHSSTSNSLKLTVRPCELAPPAFPQLLFEPLTTPIRSRNSCPICLLSGPSLPAPLLCRPIAGVSSPVAGPRGICSRS